MLVVEEPHLVDNSITRKRVLDQLGQRIEELDRVRDHQYYLETIYDPLSNNV